MPVSKHSTSTEHKRSTLLRGLLALSIGWLVVRAIESAPHEAEQARVLVEAELRIGDTAPPPVADIGSAAAALRALNARIRSGPQHPLVGSGSQATLQHPPRQRALVQLATLQRKRERPHRRPAWSWPLPRSSCRPDDEPPSDHC